MVVCRWKFPSWNCSEQFLSSNLSIYPAGQRSAPSFTPVTKLELLEASHWRCCFLRPINRVIRRRSWVLWIGKGPSWTRYTIPKVIYGLLEPHSISRKKDYVYIAVSTRQTLGWLKAGAGNISASVDVLLKERSAIHRDESAQANGDSRTTKRYSRRVRLDSLTPKSMCYRGVFP